MLSFRYSAETIAAAKAAADHARADWLSGCTDPEHPASLYLADWAADSAAKAVRRHARHAARRG